VGYLNDLLGLPWYNPVSWTLAIECEFCLFIAVVFPLLACGDAAIVGSVFASLAAATAAVPLGAAGDSSVVRWLPLFAMGTGSFRFFQRLSTRHSYAFVEGAAVCAAAVMGAHVGVVAGIIAAFCLALCTLRVSPLITAYAAMTYWLYLVHEPLCIRAVHLMQRLGNGPGALCAAMAAGVAISLLGAYVFRWLMEKSTLRFATKLKRARLPRDVQ
jgi:peptidoglycan/LPS O-acetylase OafA/YrhL